MLSNVHARQIPILGISRQVKKFPLKERTNIESVVDNSQMGNKWIDDRIKELRKLHGLRKSQRGLAEYMGLVPSGVHKIITGERRIQAPEVPLLAQYLEWPENTVLQYIGRAGASEHSRDFSETIVPLATIRVTGEVQAGRWRESLALSPDEQFEISIMDNPRFRQLPKFGLLVRGPSMNLIFPEGSIVVCVPLIHLGEGYMPENNSFVVLERYNEANEIEATIKQITFEGDSSLWLWPRSNNPEFQQPLRLPIGKDEVDQTDRLRISALVIGSYRSFT